ncbi:ribosomal L1 domain-containing protein CG13096 [Venturia canescens]|uniref:ribosomal L1 domain-containing protein CG13096 n=1 Tax=Venturia canescens TaxID=32260 RepID=UPI001C9C1F9B|nr:ribosomal L1 domain-containing protein CG13096-like [Venturia canescens]
MKKEAVSVLKPRKGKKIENKVHKILAKKGIKGENITIETNSTKTKPRGQQSKILKVQDTNVGNNSEDVSNVQLNSVSRKIKTKQLPKVQKISKLKNAASNEEKMAATPVPPNHADRLTRGPKNKRPKSQTVLDETSVATKKAKVQSSIEPTTVAVKEKPKISQMKIKVKPNIERQAERVKPKIKTEKNALLTKLEKKRLQSKTTLAVGTKMMKSKPGDKRDISAIKKGAGDSKLVFPKDKRKNIAKVEKKSTDVESSITNKSVNSDTNLAFQKEITDSGDLKLTKQHILSSIKAIKKLTQKKLSAKTSLLPTENHPILLQVNCVKIPKTPRRQIRTKLPHTIVGPTDEVALFVADLIPGRRRDFEKTVEHWEEKFREKGIECIKQILPMNQVKTEYSQFESKKKLAMSFDHFLADGRISGHLVHLLGKPFFKRHNPPTSVKLSASDLKGEIDKALCKTTMVVHSYGDSHTVRIGTLSMKSPKLVDNVLAVCTSLAAQYPGGWSNIRALYIKSQISSSIPIYMNLVSKNEVPVPVVKPKRPRAYETVEGELTTVGGGHVTATVTPEGRVTVKREKRKIKEETDNNKKIKTKKSGSTQDEDDDNENGGDNEDDEQDEDDQ